MLHKLSLHFLAGELQPQGKTNKQHAAGVLIGALTWHMAGQPTHSWQDCYRHLAGLMCV